MYSINWVGFLHQDWFCVVLKWKHVCFVQCFTEFINLISSESNEICSKEEKRTIAPEHVLRALEVCYPCFGCSEMYSSHVGGWLVIQLIVEPLFSMSACQLCVCLLLYCKYQEAQLELSVAVSIHYPSYLYAYLMTDPFSNSPINQICLTASGNFFIKFVKCMIFWYSLSVALQILGFGEYIGETQEWDLGTNCCILYIFIFSFVAEEQSSVVNSCWTWSLLQTHSHSSNDQRL